MIDEYLREFDRWAIGSVAEKTEWRAELSAHLAEARDAGDLDGALARLGSPREAAATFRSGRPLTLAAPRRRWPAVAIDHVPLLILTIVLAVLDIARGDNIFIAVPRPIMIDTRLSLAHNLGGPLALLWSWLGLALIEARTDRTPGKALLGLRAVSDDGTALTRRQAVQRRWSILAGPLVWLDFAFSFHNERRQRLLDVMAHTMVVDDPQPSHAPANRYNPKAVGRHE